MNGSDQDPPRRARGSSRMLQLGYRQCVVWLDPTEYAAIRDYTRALPDREPLATLARRLLCEAAGAEYRRR